VNCHNEVYFHNFYPGPNWGRRCRFDQYFTAGGSQGGALGHTSLQIHSTLLLQVYHLANPRMAIVRSADALEKIKLSNYQKSVLWDAFKDDRHPHELTVDDLKVVPELLVAIPEDELSNLNVSDWGIIELLGNSFANFLTG
jgi:hypothetical protein